MSRTAAVALAVIAIVAGVAGALVGTPWNDHTSNSAIGNGPTTTAAQRDPTLSIVATAVPGKKSVVIYDAPEGAEKTTLANPNDDGVALTFLTREQRPGWVRVMLPVRPNGSEGWVKASDVRMTSHNYKIKVELSAHRVVVTDHGDVFVDTPAAIGKAGTATPLGEYYTTELIQPPNQNTVYGHYVYALSGFSDVIFHFEGGDGVIGIHGTNDPSDLGKDVSHGCIRISNEAIEKLAKTLPLGVPVEIVA